MPLTATNIEHGVVAARPDQMYGWPGITRTEEDDILVAASERIYHQAPQGRTVVMRSADSGRTWSQPQEVYNSEQDDRDASLRTMPDGTVILSSFSTTDWVPYVIDGNFVEGTAIPERWRSQWRALIERQGLTGERPQRSWLMRSEDDGRAWGPPIDTPTGQHAGPGVLSDGRLIYVGLGKIEERGPICAWESTDKGDTWDKVGEIPRPKESTEELELGENHLVETSPGHLVVMFRSGERGAGDWDSQFLYQSHSHDAGRNWSEAERLPVWGYPPHLTVLSSGAVLCSYGHRREPLSVRAMLSDDEGQTWDYENFITLYELPAKHDFGYPVSVELSPGEILTVYYLNKKYVQRDDKFYHLPYVEDAGGIMSARWTLE
jgi:hypothetical protein